MKLPLSLVFLLVLTSSLQLFAANSCHTALIEKTNSIDVSTLGYTWMSFDRYSEFDYSDRKKVLFLSDGSVSAKVSKNKRSPVFIGTDGVEGTEGEKPHVLLDNNCLPFAAGSFDLIVMNRGMCVCHSRKKTCGGIGLTEGSVRRFLEKVAQSLDPKNPLSLALLTGYYVNESAIGRIPDLFRSQVKSLQEQFPDFEFVELVDPSLNRYGTDSFMGIAIFARGTSLALSLGDLKLPH